MSIRPFAYLLVIQLCNFIPGSFADEVDYQKTVAPILQKHCAGCHNDQDREGEFSLQSLRALKLGGTKGSVISAGKPDESKLLQLVEHRAEPHMPPKEEPQLSAAQISLLRQWIAEGAKGQDDAPKGMQISAPKLKSDVNAAKYASAAGATKDGGLVIGRFQSVELFDATGQNRKWKFNDLSGKVNQIRTTSDGQTLVVATGVAGVGGEAILLSVASGELLGRFVGHKDTIYSAALSPDGKWLATGSYDRKAILWDRSTGEAKATLSGHNGAVYDLDFDPTSSIIATASADQTVKIWNLAGDRLDTLGQPEGEMHCVRFSRDGSSIFAAGADRQIRKWQLLSRNKPAINPLLVARFAHEDVVLQIELINDQLVSISKDRSMKLWDTDQLRPLGSLATTSDTPVGLAVSEKAVLVSRDGSLASANLTSLAPVTEKTATAQNATPLPQETKSVSSFSDGEPNNTLGEAAKIDLPAEVTGLIDAAGGQRTDVDLYRFSAQAGESWVFEVNAARNKSKLDSFIDILNDKGENVVRARLQATRESYFTFRGKDSNTSDDFRVHNWQDMELNEYLYSNGEVVKLWLYPRGPDSGFKVYPGFGSRFNYFDTTPLSHALGEPAYIVRELSPNEDPLPNGLPVFKVFYENDDDSLRRWGSDSRLSFTAPETGEYFLRVRDARGLGGPEHNYSIGVHRPKPDFEIAVTGQKMQMPIGSGREWQVTATRHDGLESPITIELHGLPEGFEATNPVIIESGQLVALGTVFATSQVKLPVTTDEKKEKPEKEKPEEKPESEKQLITVSLVAKAQLGDQVIEHKLAQELQIELTDKPELQLKLIEVAEGSQGSTKELEELTIRLGQTVSAQVIIDRQDQKGPISFGKEDSGRNLPHGIIVDNIGLNGLLIPEGMNEREFFITASKWLEPQRRQIHLRTEAKGNSTSRPIWLNVLPAN